MGIDKDYTNKYLKHRFADETLLDILITELGIEKSQALLDFGCGTGNYLLALKRRGFTKLFALDKSIDMVKVASERTGIKVAHGSHLDIPFRNDSFDAVMLIAMIHFIPQDQLSDLFINLKRICKEHGRIVIVTQSFDQIDKRFYNKYFPSLPEIDKKNYHDISILTSLAEEYKFPVHNIQEYYGENLIVDNAYYNLIRDKSFYVLRRLSDAEFEKGLIQFEKDMDKHNWYFSAPFAGWTIITLENIR